MARKSLTAKIAKDSRRPQRTPDWFAYFANFAVKKLFEAKLRCKGNIGEALNRRGRREVLQRSPRKPQKGSWFFSASSGKPLRTLRLALFARAIQPGSVSWHEIRFARPLPKLSPMPAAHLRAKLRGFLGSGQPARKRVFPRAAAPPARSEASPF